MGCGKRKYSHLWLVSGLWHPPERVRRLFAYPLRLTSHIVVFSFFTTYARSAQSWSYSFGQFAAQALPLSDSVTLKLKLVNETETRTITIPYQSRFVAGGVNFTDSVSFRAGNCRAVDGTNGASYYDTKAQNITLSQKKKIASPGALERKHPVNAFVDVQPLTDVALPPALQPQAPLNGSTSVAQFFLLDDGITGVLMLGSFSDIAHDLFYKVLLDGLQGLKSKGAQRLSKYVLFGTK